MDFGRLSVDTWLVSLASAGVKAESMELAAPLHLTRVGGMTCILRSLGYSPASTAYLKHGNLGLCPDPAVSIAWCGWEYRNALDARLRPGLRIRKRARLRDAT